MELSSENIEDLAIAMSDSCSTLRSFNDILDDIREMGKTMESDQAAANVPNSTLSFPDMPDLSMGSPFHMPDIGIQQDDYSPDCSFSGQTDFLQPLGQWPEYLSSLPPSLENLQEVPQLTSSVPTPPPPTVPCSQTPQEPPPNVAAVNVNPNQDELQLVSSVPVVPLQIFNNFHFNFSPPLLPQSEPPNPSPHFLAPMDSNFNIWVKDQSAVPKKRTRIEKQQPCFGWARVVPRKAFVQPTQVVRLRPLRTRKAASSRQSFDLSSYFDTSAISIPMIRERPRCKNENRRKQKLCTIPGADNMIFEVQLLSTIGGKTDHIDENNKFIDANNNSDQLYPETDIPELDEIFKRKRRGVSTRRNPQPQDQVETPKSNHSLEEKKAVTSAVPPLPEEERVESNSDIDSDDAPLTAVKSMKCQSCRKLFKTCRSLTIHSKRCEAMPHVPVKDKPPDYGQTRSIRQMSVQSSSSKENIDIEGEEEKLPIEQGQTARPLTRSQTNAAKRKAAGSHNAVATKKKC